MPDVAKRSRLRVDLPTETIRAIRVRAGLEGVDGNVIVARALDVFLKEEIQLVRRKHQAGGKRDDGPSPQKQ